MKEQLYTIPLNDAFMAGDECPFCFIRRSLEQHAIEFSVGASQASYMEDDVRAETDKTGFCREHYRKMFIYGNKLGNAMILETHLKRLTKEMTEEMKNHTPGAAKKGSLFGRLGGAKPEKGDAASGLVRWLRQKEKSCFICEQMDRTYARYLDTFFEMYKKDAAFRDRVKEGKGFCLPHFGDVVEGAERRLNEKEQKELTDVLFPQMLSGLARITGDVEWFQKKFDYQFRDADWKESRDAVQRAMQKAAGGYPADPPFEADK